MSERYGVGRYGMGDYSSATTEDRASTIASAVLVPTVRYNRLRDGKDTIAMSAAFQKAKADNLRNARSAIDATFGISALPTYVRSLNGSATLGGGFAVTGRANYTTDGSSTIQLVPALSWVYFEGKYWNPEGIENENWTPEVVPDSIWTPEVISGSPWG